MRPEPFLAFVCSRTGHFQMESGHHTDYWMDLESLCQRPAAIQPFAADLAERLRPHQVDAVCGPLNEGAFVALMVASGLACEFSYAERFVDTSRAGLFPVDYRVPAALHSVVRDKRVAIVNDVISAGSAVLGALADLQRLGAHVVAIGSLLVLGDAIGTFAREHDLPLEALAQRASHIWTPEECPLCRQNAKLVRA